MKMLMVAVPLFNLDMAVDAYRLHTRSGDHLYGIMQDRTMSDDALNSPDIEALRTLGIEPFTGGKPLLINISKLQLWADVLKDIAIPPEQLVLLLGADIPIDDDTYERCRKLKMRGYHLALRAGLLTPVYEKMYQLCHYCIHDTRKADYMRMHMEIRKRAPYIKAIFDHVDEQEAFLLIRNRRRALFEGRFFNQPYSQGKHTITATKTTAIKLLRLMSDPNFRIDQVAEIIRQDPAITLSLFRFLNSPVSGLRHRISTIQQAIATLGQRETIRWLAIALSSQLAEDKPNEISRLSLIRAKFAENLAVPFGMEANADSLFLIGLFSLLDVILKKPMLEAVSEVGLDAAVAQPLARRTGPYYDVLKFIYAYESADWDSMIMDMIHKNIDTQAVHQAFVDALMWYKRLLGPNTL